MPLNAPEFARTEDGTVGRVVAVFLDGAWARNHLACWACDGIETVRGYDLSMPEHDGPVYLLQLDDRSQAMVRADGARAASAREWEEERGRPLPEHTPEKPRVLGRTRQCRTCDGDGCCPRCSTPRQCDRCDGRGFTVEDDQQANLPFVG